MQETVLFGRYRLIEPAGAGGSAQVWRALDTSTGDTVAVKRLHPIVFADPAARARLDRESRALESLDHPNVVALRDVHVADDEAALILDYVDGVSLADRIASGPPMAVGEVVSVVQDVASALTAAHAVGIVHRDVKPANVILAADGRALLTDFGIAADGTADGATAALTATGTILGTFRYMAPELLRGAPASPSSDQYALAAVAYELLGGRPPYDATTPVALAEAQAAAAPPPLPGVRPALAGAVLRGLERDPAARHGDVAAFAAAVAGSVRAAPSNLDTDVATAVTGGAAVTGGVGIGAPAGTAVGALAGTPTGTAAAPGGAHPARGASWPGAAAGAERPRPRWMSLAAVATLAVVMIVLGAMAGGLNRGEPTDDAPAGGAASGPVPVTPAPDPTAVPEGDGAGGNGNGEDRRDEEKPDKDAEKPDKDDDKPDKGKGNGGD